MMKGIILGILIVMLFLAGCAEEKVEIVNEQGNVVGEAFKFTKSTYQLKSKAPSGGGYQAAVDAKTSLNQPLKDAVWELKVNMLETALDRAKHNQKKAARILGLTYHQFRGLYRRYQAANNE